MAAQGKNSIQRIIDNELSGARPNRIPRQLFDSEIGGRKDEQRESGLRIFRKLNYSVGPHMNKFKGILNPANERSQGVRILTMKNLDVIQAV